jgi:hypothetical protein
MGTVVLQQVQKQTGQITYWSFLILAKRYWGPQAPQMGSFFFWVWVGLPIQPVWSEVFTLFKNSAHRPTGDTTSELRKCLAPISCRMLRLVSGLPYRAESLTSFLAGHPCYEYGGGDRTIAGDDWPRKAILAHLTQNRGQGAQSLIAVPARTNSRSVTFRK